MELKLKYNKDLIKKSKIIRAKFSPNIHPHAPQDICFIKTEAGEINKFCKDCEFLGKSKFTRFCTGLGMNGYMHQEGDGLDPKHQGEKKFRKPITKIIQKGERWVCHNSEAGGRAGIYILTDKVPHCKWKMKKEGD